MFSRRTDWALGSSRLAERVSAHRAAGRPLVDLTDANPARAALPLPDAEIRAALADPGALGHEPAPFGRREARAAVARLYAGAVGPEGIALCASTSEAYAWLLKLLCEPGDRVLVPVPSYPLLDYLAALECVEVDRAPLLLEAGDRFGLDCEDLARRVTERTRAIFLVSPNHPTGAVLRHDELARVAALCRERDLALVVDEVFGAWHAREDPELVASTAGEPEALTFVLDGLSKRCLQPQLKLAWIAASGPGPTLGEALQRLEAIADAYLSVNGPVQVALPRLLELAPRLQAPLRARLAANRRALASLARGGPCGVPLADGGWSAVLRVPRTRGDEEWALAILDEAEVLVHPGFLYDFPSEGWLVVNAIAPEAVFRAAIQRTLDCVRRAAGGAATRGEEHAGPPR
jgi:aspartate/methionine/tyrosine aminotransferase